jgi:hypothetical protein
MSKRKTPDSQTPVKVLEPSKELECAVCEDQAYRIDLYPWDGDDEDDIKNLSEFYYCSSCSSSYYEALANNLVPIPEKIQEHYRTCCDEHVFKVHEDENNYLCQVCERCGFEKLCYKVIYYSSLLCQS